jgi:hypothetical protein
MSEPEPHQGKPCVEHAGDDEQLVIGDRWREWRRQLSASSLGTPSVLRLRERGHSMLTGEPQSTVQRRLTRIGRIGRELRAGRIEEQEAFVQLREAGCTPRGAERWLAAWDAER